MNNLSTKVFTKHNFIVKADSLSQYFVLVNLCTICKRINSVSSGQQSVSALLERDVVKKTVSFSVAGIC
jgi:hypothetical protein